MKFYPYENRGRKKLQPKLKGGGHKTFPPFKEGEEARTVLPCLESGVQKVSDPQFPIL